MRTLWWALAVMYGVLLTFVSLDVYFDVWQPRQVVSAFFMTLVPVMLRRLYFGRAS
jgi:hypothetical protein